LAAGAQGRRHQGYGLPIRGNASRAGMAVMIMIDN
jgi:hypothetical protein